MRRRSPEELNDPERQKRLLAQPTIVPAYMRNLLREHADKRVGRLLAIIDSEVSSDGDVIRAYDLLLRYGLGSTSNLVTEDEKLPSGVVVLPTLDDTPAGPASSANAG